MSKNKQTPEEREEEDREQLMLVADVLRAIRCLSVSRGVNWYEALVEADKMFAAKQPYNAPPSRP